MEQETVRVGRAKHFAVSLRAVVTPVDPTTMCCGLTQCTLPVAVRVARMDDISPPVTRFGVALLTLLKARRLPLRMEELFQSITPRADV